jgi:acetyl esterase/lipase
VFTRAQGKDEELLPVIVFLHGGAFQGGSCESLLYGPQVRHLTWLTAPPRCCWTGRWCWWV